MGRKPSDRSRTGGEPCERVMSRLPRWSGAPPCRPRLDGLGTTIFAEMSALAARTGAINLGQGFPDTDGPSRWPTPRSRPSAPATTSTRPAPASRSCGRRSPRTRSASGASRSIPDRGARHRGRHRGDRRRRARPVRARRRDPRLRADLRLLPGRGGDGRRARCGPCGSRRRDYHFDVEALAARVTARTRLVLLNSPHNPTGKVFSVDELDAIARLCVEHDLIAVTDEVYEHLVFDGAHVPLASVPGHGRADPDDLVGGQDVLVHRLEDRLGLRPRGAGGRGPHRQAVPHLRERRAVPARGGRRARPRRRLLRRAARRATRKRDLLCDGLAGAGFDVFLPAGTYFATVDIRPVGGDDGPTFCRRSPSAAVSSRCRARCSTRTPPPASTSCASRSASARRCSPEAVERLATLS